MTVPVPGTLDEMLSPDWLTGALGARFPGIAVTAVTPGSVISRIATNARFRIECADGVPAGLSPDLCGKGYFTEAGHAFRHAGIPEACFYRDVAARSGVRTLRSVYADVDPRERQGVVITEDVIVEGAEFLDARSDYTPDQAAESLAQLATLHASTWGAADLATTEWLAPRLTSYLQLRGVDDIRVNFDGPIGAGVPAEVRDADRLVRAYRSLATLTAQDDEPWCVIHGDAHVGNVFLDGAGRPSFLDWQLVQRGPWYLDVGYHIASALTVSDRRRTERDLVAHYLDRLRAAGVEAPPDNAVWPGIGRGIIHGLYLWAITLKVDPAVTSLLLTRLGTAAADHDALTAFDR
ncbi:Phosphotransferase enzyme family protein [Parafrankia irregularis]|uniref:Phosphotransferase enzyme family protein n=1 Tax=Parafrankia irregularis TaxID=795642 RepID=A0A0S4QLZ3_9ACTN|nr:MULTISPECIES: aminoglycoside phosphotransferase family protein [Parafrankia]MBE3200118.1 aminoglycoside phosphotransferase family protein [Parafrankia sp. CH37]CUU56693.1 Phosphotransferase enzyme family protein [Parafrankia irregularis]